jgi:fluoroacetyl-CoA thioesterase
MINPFKPGDTKTYTKTVEQTDTAAFDSGQVHPVYATFALGRDAEWACGHTYLGGTQ